MSHNKLVEQKKQQHLWKHLQERQRGGRSHLFRGWSHACIGRGHWWRGRSHGHRRPGTGATERLTRRRRHGHRSHRWAHSFWSSFELISLLINIWQCCSSVHVLLKLSLLCYCFNKVMHRMFWSDVNIIVMLCMLLINSNIICLQWL